MIELRIEDYMANRKAGSGGGGGGGLFGSSGNTNTGGSLFGNKPNNASGGLFGNNTATSNSGGGLFGNTSTSTSSGKISAISLAHRFVRIGLADKSTFDPRKKFGLDPSLDPTCMIA